MNNLLIKIKNNLCTFIIFVVAFITRFIAMINATPTTFQHDVMYKNGHLDYAAYIFRYWKLGEHNIREFSQPPINAFMQAVVMKILSPFIGYNSSFYTKLYEPTKILSFIYSSLTVIIIYKIINCFDFNKKIKNLIFGIIVLYPGIIIMSTQYSNDNIAYMFFYLSLYLSIKWTKEKQLKTIILLALSIGIGMLTKVSVGLIAFITGPIMIAVFIKEKNKKVIIKQLIIFALIVFPIGLSYSIRNYIVFNQPIGSIYEIGLNTKLDLRKYSYTIVDRFLSIPFNKFFERKYYIYHNELEYNVWIDLIKTSTFDEFNFGRKNIVGNFCIIIYILNIIFYIFSFISIIITMINVVYSICIKKIRHNNSLMNFRIICLMLFTLAIFAYLFFNIKYPYSCNSNYRYISYITFAMAGCLVTSIAYFNK